MKLEAHRDPVACDPLTL
jgi:small subunit ribosomal protein S6e